MRIIGGTAAGLLLKVPKGFDVRPTPDLVKQALFNSLGARVVGARVLELFAGSGALGLECLSRGAAQVVSVEKANRHARMIRENLEAIHLDPKRFDLRVQDAFQAIAQLAEASRQFDLVLADPPYGEKNVGRRSTSFAQQLLDDARLPSLIAPDGLLVIGHTKRDTLTVPAAWAEVKMLKHGDSVIRFFDKGDRLSLTADVADERG
ncbi:MAG: 16S rRNA (guanine(966)-N(2))-methyltransferase RsmD [Verrucomicrobia bacterium]|nr:16S rRNA (guanine(966)-N(2))-methyltransferase RsmD [Verrucomicrobiota bacterium]